jgi:hypothetical protein
MMLEKVDITRSSWGVVSLVFNLHRAQNVAIAY